ncbi:amino acid adenylation enzyme/thioester reductase family protein [Herbaspirillum sp. CF444]|uniref:non-ribosomal peptide synthetase/type I polyketide synthase n=1 Tax=Herbaspirillum sp. CF444 TaxID=1144319 RepID=UPI00027262D0|nr:non-ribosomal peptide synthetase/type I polyketide synthase [Herbaspirillum sp. CF444]EJL94053.1 amino acid adenylation enzyme/thioester reductase family protein [Herbaspirillum sp. CF444]
MTTPEMPSIETGLDAALDAALLADLLAEDGFELPSEESAIPRRAASARVLATPAQQRLWTVERIDGVTGEFNLGMDIRFNAPINVAALERALLALLQRHEGLRAGFSEHDDGSIGQTFTQVDSLSLTQHAMPAASWPAFLREAVAQPFDLAADLLLRAQLLHDDDAKSESESEGGASALLLTFHHSIIDMWSGHLLLRELVMLYARELGKGNETVTLPEPVQFGDYATWLREPQQAAAREQLHGYWKTRLEQLPTALELPFSGPRGQAGATLCERIPVVLPAPLTAAVKRFADTAGTTPFVVILAAFHAVLARYSGMDDIAVGVPVVNRPRQQEQGIVGFLSETMVSRNLSERSQSFGTLTEQVRDHMLEDLRHQGLPFDDVVKLVNPERRTGLAPLFQAMLVFQTMPPLQAQAGAICAHAATVPLPAARADLLLELEAGAEHIEGGLEYRRNFIDPQIAAAMAASVEVVLEAALADPQLPLSQLPLQRSDAAREMLARLNPPLPSLPGAAPRTLSAWFTEQAARTPDAVALIDAEGGGETTYAELDRRSAALAAHLAQLGVVAETPVAICLPRSADLAVAILATLRAGGAFVPMDPNFPAERLRYMLDSSGATVLMTTGAPDWLAADVPAAQQPRLVDPSRAFPQASAPPDLNGPDSLLYILYTSGSTGRPKAVMGLHRGAVNRIAWMLERYPFEPRDRYCQKTTPTFVDFVWELFGPLLGGVPSVILSAAQVRDPRALASAMQQHGVTRLTLVPSLLKSLLDHVADVGNVLGGLRHCICSSEAFPGDLARRFLSLLPDCRLLNLYGSSEASADSTCYDVDTAEGPQVQIGRPIPGNLLAILDPAGNVLPVGAAGEIMIGGIGLARGYLSLNGGEPRFVTLPADVAGGRAFRSGDLGRWRPDGGIDYLGRLDRQVKIRGVRIDPEEVRVALRRCPGVADAVVVAREVSTDGSGELILMAYVVAKESVEPALRRCLQDILPMALQPSRYVFMPDLPLNSNGKIDFLALPAPDGEVAAQAPETESAMTLEENLLADIWRQVIGSRPQHPQANFFQSGGHSLSAIRLVAALEKNLDVRLPVTAVFDAPSLRAMALEVRRAQRGAGLPEVVAGGPHRRARASFNQERLWLIEQSGQQRGAYNQAVVYRLRGQLDVERLETAFRRVMQRHEALRTRLVLADGLLWQEVQEVHASPEFALERIAADDGRQQIAPLLQEFSERFFSLAEDLPLRAGLIGLGPTEHLLAIVAHHTAFDGGSGRVIVEELGQAYSGVLDAAPAALQQIDFSEWQRHCDEQGAFEAQRNYWRDQLAGAPAVLGLALSRMPEQRDFRLGRVPVALGRERSERLQQAADDAGLSVFALLLGVWGLTLARFGGEQEVVVGIPVAGRSRTGLDGIVGFLANTLPMRLDCSAANLAEFGRRVQQRVAEGLQHQDISFSRIVEAAGVERIPQRPPLLQAMFVLADLRQWQLQLDAIDAVAEPLSAPLARTDLSMALHQDAQGIAGELEYAADVIAPALAGRIAEGFAHLLEALLAQPDVPPLSHSLLDAPARALLAQFGQARTVLPPASEPLRLHDLLRAGVQRNGDADAAALATPEGELSYRQLDRLSGDFARRLRTAGINPGDRIALIGERSIGLIAALLGISKAGCVFVPIDPTYPSVRIEQMLQDAGVALVAGDRPADWNEAQWMRLPVLQDLSCAPEQDESKHSHGEFDKDFAATACIIFTSGSTGRPKGVALAHHALCRLAQSAVTEFSVTQESRILQLAAFGFDVAVSDIVFALAAGACLCLAPRERLLPGSPLLQTLGAMHISHLQIPASLLAAMPLAPLPSLRTLIVGGELCPAAVASQWQQGRDLFIAYGPTETTVTVTAGRYAGADAPLQIGRPLGDARIYVLDEQGAPAPIGVIGELCIGGPGVSIGYLNNPALTQERFRPDPFSDDPQARLYRSGDRARWREDGSLDFLGRSDREFKLRGFRIAPAEIEAALSQQAGVTQALAMLRPDSAGQRRLVAYVVGAGTDAATIRSELRRSLPSFMVPDFIAILDSMPLTGNGKIDVNALPLPVFEREGVASGNTESREGRDCLARVAGLWRQVLNLKDIAPDANFFDVGGHSLLLVRLYDLLTVEFGAAASISDLFRFPTIRSLAAHLSGQGDIRETGKTVHAPLLAQADIAVIGMACRFPGAPDVDAFWQLLVEGREGISRHDPASLAEAGRAADVQQQANFVAAGGVIGQADCFDADFFGLGPRDAVTLDPQHRVALECAWHALEHGGYAAMEARGDVDVGVFVGVGVNTYLQGQLFGGGPMPESADTYHAMSGNDKDFGATRIAYHLDLKGPALAVQTACSSSLAALDMACRSLRSGAAGMALAGGVAIRFPQGSGYFHEPGMILSPDGHCKPFSADARGTVPSGGVGMVLLKPLAQAQADGDNVLAVIRGSAVNNDGGRKVGYAAPGVDGQAAVIASALKQAGLEPGDIDYVEAHGTGTELGDPVEIAALTRVFGGRQRPLALGSVKSNIGHADAAAGIAGLIKTILALQHGVLPPSLHFSSPNPHVDFTAASIGVVGSVQAWPAQESGHPRRAGVSAFGIGGTNVHVVLEQAPARLQTASATISPPVLPPVLQVLPLSARTPASLRSSMLALADVLQGRPQLALRDVAFTLQQGRAAFGCRHALVASSNEEAMVALRLAAEQSGTEPVATIKGAARLAFLFPGQGSQYPRMAQALYESDAGYRSWFDRCAVALLPHVEQDIRTVLYGVAADDPAAVAALGQTALAQPVLFSVMYALARSLEARGVEAVAMLGHSLGEYVAACLAGVFELDDALALVAMRGRLMQALPGGAMLAVQADEAQAHGLMRTLMRDCGDAIGLAAVNGPGQCVLSGATDAIDELQARLKEINVPAVRLDTSHAFHSAAMDPVLPDFVAQFDRITLMPPQRRFISNVTGTWISDADAVDPAYWARHLRQAVRFGDGLDTLQRDGVDLLLEVGPGSALQKLARTGGWPAAQLIALGMHRQARQQVSALETIVAQLWTRGALIDWRKGKVSGPASGDAGAPSRVALPGYVFERTRHWPAPQPAIAATVNSQERRADIADWFYLPGWQRAPQLSAITTSAASSTAPDVWLLLGAETDAGRALATGLRAFGQQLVEVRAAAAFEALSPQDYAIDPASEQDYRRLLDSVAPTRVVHLWASVVQPFEMALERGFASVMLLAQAIGAGSQARTLQLDIVTCGAADVSGDEQLASSLGTLLGLAKILPVEYRSLTCRLIDIEAEGSVPMLLNELLHAKMETQVALRRRHRWVPHLQPVKLAAPEAGGDRLRRQGCYLITGAFGGMGASIARDLATRYRARLVLLGRHVDRALVAELERAGVEVLASACDVADAAALTPAIASAHARFGVIHGVFHCAGVADLGGIIQNRSVASMHQVMAAKVQGTVLLDRLLEGDALDFMVLFSTLGNLLPQAKFGQAAYAAANEFLDLFAHERNARGGGFTTVLNWDDWSEAGMTVAAYRRHGQAAPDSNEAMRSQEGIEVLRRVLASPHARVAVSIRDLPGLMARADVLLDRLSTPTPLSPAGAGMSASAGASGMNSMTDTEAKLAATWRSILGVADITREANFFELGGHSLIGMRLLAFVRESFGVDLNITAVFEHATLAALAGHIDQCRSGDDGIEEFTI